MKRIAIFLGALLFSGCDQSATPLIEAGAPSAPGTQAIADSIRRPEIQRVAPFKIFDNLYYVGIHWVAAYLLVTSEGLVLIDSLYGEYVPILEQNIRTLGFRPADVRYVLVTHGHFDHVGGARYFQQQYGAHIAMSREDWRLAKAGAEAHPERPVPEEDLVMGDGDALELGNQRIRFMLTPGHTPGVLSMFFTVQDGKRKHTAFDFGGIGFNFSGVARTERYIESVEKVMAHTEIEVSLPNHPQFGQVFERAERLAERKPGEPHPFVAPQEFQAWLAELLGAANAKLEYERTHE